MTDDEFYIALCEALEISYKEPSDETSGHFLPTQEEIVDKVHTTNMERKVWQGRAEELGWGSS